MRLAIRTILPVAAISTLLIALAASAAPAMAAGPSWAIRSVALPSNFSEQDSERCQEGKACDTYLVTVTNVGDEPAGELVFTDTLPRGVVLVETVFPFWENSTCTEGAGRTSIACRYEHPVQPGETIEMGLEVATTAEIGASVTSVTNLAEVEGGGAPPAVTSKPSTIPNTVNGTTPTFGFQDFSVDAFAPDGGADLQAGDHPAGVTTSIQYPTTFGIRERHNTYEWITEQEAKTQIVSLPLGFMGDPLAAGTCSLAELRGVDNEHDCPAGSQVGIVSILAGREGVTNVPVYNVTPELAYHNGVASAAYPAEFGFEFLETVILLRSRVLPSPDGYTLSVTVPGIPRSREFPVTGVAVTFFGDPTEHDGVGNGEALFTNPDDCGTAPLEARVEMDSWVDPSRWVSAQSPMYEASATQGVTGCGALQFEPAIEVEPEQTTADIPSGYEVDLKVPQARNAPGLLATPDLKNAVVRLPEGVAISPSAANGLTACQEAGPEGINITHEWTPTAEQPLDPADPEAMEIGADGLSHVAGGHCPQSSQVGSVEVLTPLLASPLHGHVYIAEPQCGGEGQSACTTASATNGELYGLYLEAEGSGVIIKLKGTVSANPTTGQLTTSFTENPQFPFSELKLHLNGGERAPLANPQTCASLEATSDLTPWSAPVTPDATPSWSFAISGCASPMGFAPSFLAHTTTPAAGAFSPFTLTLSRHDGEQDLSGLTVNMPQGLLGRIAGISQCAEAPANAGSCPAASRVGTVTAAAGAGSAPFWQSGPVYLTGPYNGAPFGLAVVVPANAGPFHLGNIVVRAAIHINPSTAAVTVVSNPLPQMIDGVPLRVKTVNVTVGNESNFTFNPTNCAAVSIAATIDGAQGASANVSAPFAATGCASLPFKPVLSASTVAKASKAGGASLDVKISSSAGQANIAKVDLQIPKQLSSRLTTLQKACTEGQFAANPAGCPAASNIGSAVVHTPVLNSPLVGPVYLVSHGGAAFPDVEIILQGEGVQLIVDGKTQIKKGITYSHFEAVPDAPFTSFETKLPTGRYSIFAANLPAKTRYDFCGQSLNMPIEIVGQNGAVVKQTTKVGVTGCPKAKKAGKKNKKRKGKKADNGHGDRKSS
jgi:hypothetical protein